jgi:hypothetical protein
MLELYFLVYRIPRMMSQLARERNRSPVAWSLIAIGAWLGAEIGVGFGAGILYGIAGLVLGWRSEMSAGFQLLAYLVSLGAAIASVTIVRRILSGYSATETTSLPPPPPSF